MRIAADAAKCLHVTERHLPADHASPTCTGLDRWKAAKKFQLLALYRAINPEQTWWDEASLDSQVSLGRCTGPWGGQHHLFALDEGPLMWCCRRHARDPAYTIRNLSA